MCGISGFVLNSANNYRSNGLSQAFAASLHHRGPDEHTIVARDSVTLVSNRLSIIDLANGSQPFISASRDVYVIQNGEIYNYIELREELIAKGSQFRTQSDTEVILEGYVDQGISFVEKLNGMFAIAILDLRERSLYLIRDRLGVKPLFFTAQQEGIYFASEIKAFYPVPGFSKELDMEAIYLYLTYNFVPLPRTIFRNVFHVAPATYLRIDINSGVQSSRTYWSIPNEPEDLTDEKAIVTSLEEIFHNAVSIRLRSDVPIGTYLSSGIDSSLVTSAAVKTNLAGDFEAFSIRFEDSRFDESSDALNFAKELGISSHIVTVDPSDLADWRRILWNADQPHGDISFLALNKLSQVSRRTCKVVLTGDGGDELFGGYEKYRQIFFGQSIEDYLEQESVISPDTIGQKLYVDSFLRSINRDAPRDLFDSQVALVNRKELLSQVMYFDVRQLLPGNNLVKTDRMTMANSVEARSPLLDYRLYEIVMRIPSKIKLQNGSPRYLERVLASSYLPPHVIQRKKKMLAIPLGEWMRGHLKNFFMDFFLEKYNWDRGIVHRQGVLSLLEQHISGRADHRRSLRALVALEMWIQEMESK